MSIAAVAPLTQSEPKPLGVVRIECHYPVVALALKEILKEEAEVYDEASGRPLGAKDPSCIVACADGKGALASLVRRLKASYPDAAVVLFSMHADSRVGQWALRAGASGFLHPEMSSEEIVRVIRLASRGRAVVPDRSLENVRGVAEEPVRVDRLTVLTPRQRQIVELVCEGLSNAQIAQHLFLTESTVKQHLRAAYKLLKVRSRTQAAMLLRRELEVPGSPGM